jgi:cytochrome P450
VDILRQAPRFSAAKARGVAREFDLTRFPVDFIDNPYPYYHALQEYEPVKWQPGDSVFITRYEDLETVYKQAKLFSSDKKTEFLPKFGDSLTYEHHTTSLVFNDPPLHTQVRRTIQGALTPRAIALMEPNLVRLVDGLLDAAEVAGRLDIIADFAAAIPIEVIGNLLHIPHEDRGPLRDWSLAILGALEPVISTEQLKASNHAVKDFLDYLKLLIADRRANLGDPDADVLSRLIVGEASGNSLSELELLHNCIFLLNAGHETTTNLIGNGLMALLEWPGERARLTAQPELIDSAIDELLRFESSNQLGNRRALQATEINGVAIPAGTSIILGIGAANRDPAKFADPDRLDMGRYPNRHLAFGSGPHLCLGHNLARLEGSIAIGRFVARFPGYEPGGEAIRGGRVRFRGYAQAPVVTNT